MLLNEILETEELRRRVDQFKWFHSIDFGNGVVSKGRAKLRQLKAQANIYFPESLAGKSLLDIGCWDGFNAVEAVRRGAARVLATDHFVWANVPGITRESIELVRDVIAPSMEIRDIDLPDISPESVGTFDVVLFCGVLYHLRHPLRGLEIAASVAAECLIVETHLDAPAIGRPAAIFYPGEQLNGDQTNWWGPNRPCVEAMLRDVGFADITFVRHPTIPTRGIFRAKRTREMPLVPYGTRV